MMILVKQSVKGSVWWLALFFTWLQSRYLLNSIYKSVHFKRPKIGYKFI